MANLAIFLDGTWNSPEDSTSVYELKECVEVGPEAHVPQEVYYAVGVGVKPFEKLRGGAFGMGLTDNILHAYRWLVDHYTDGDRVFIFGFSRGAYTARSLAGLIARCGLLRKPYASRASAIFDRYKLDKKAERIDELEFIEANGKRPLTSEERRLLNESRRVDIEMIGVWDTVGSLGIPWTAAPFFGPKDYYFLNTRPSVLYRNCFHALAIDECRGPYLPALWTEFIEDGKDPLKDSRWNPATFEQRWFIGAHANIGGGYGKADSLRNPPLVWLQGKASALGLRFKCSFTLSGEESTAEPAKSYEQFMHGIYRVVKLGRRSYRTIGRGPAKVEGGWSVPVNETIDESVFASCKARAVVPHSLREWGERKSKNIALLQGTQDA